MKRRRRTNGENESAEVDRGGVQHEVPKSTGGVKLGDLIWVKLHPSSWWPAQVVDADTVSELTKPGERSVGEVLVRVYGSYLYLYVDPLESRTEFDKVSKLYNGNYDQILKESLEKDLPHSSKYEGLAGSEATQSIGEVSHYTFFDTSPEEDNNTQAKKEYDLSGTRISGIVPKRNGRKLCSGTNKKSRKKNIAVVEKELSLPIRVSPRRKFACNKLETTFMNGNPTSEMGNAIVGKSGPTKQRLHSQTADNETTHLDSENTGKVDSNISIPYKAVVPISIHPGASARSKRIMQSLGLIAPLRIPFQSQDPT